MVKVKTFTRTQVKGSRDSSFDKQMQLFCYSDQTDSEIRTNNSLAFRSKKERTIKFDCTKQTDDTRLLTFQYSQYTLHQLAELNYQLAETTRFGGLNLIRIPLKFSDSLYFRSNCFQWISGSISDLKNPSWKHVQKRDMTGKEF